MLNKFRCFFVMFGLFCGIFSGCTTISGANHGKTRPLNTPFTLPADAYLGLAQRQGGEERTSLMILAAGRAIYDGKMNQAEAWLKALEDCTPIQEAQKNILLAKIFSLKNQSREALALIARVQHVNDLTLFYQVQYHEILASSYDAMARYPEAIGERMLLDPLLPTAPEKNRNRRVMWLALTSLPDAELETMLVEWPDSPLLKGWLSLAKIAKSMNGHSSDWMGALKQWRQKYSNHPALSMLPSSYLQGTLNLYPRPQHIALLLPMHGPLEGPGRAVYDGVVAGLSTWPVNEQPKLQVYDTTQANIKKLYRSALESGAQFVIGPLSKSDVTTMASVEHPVPTLMLNDAHRSSDDQGFFMTLSPTHEAQQVATQARLRGYEHALVIAPEGAWGDEMTQSFVAQWKKRGGQLTEVLKYAAQADLNSLLKNFLKAGSAEERRQDFDMIFLVAYPSKAREIMPILKYYYLGQIPVFATSSVYSGTPDPKQDRDLDGIYFCDMPYVFSHHLPNKHWPEQLNSYGRLYALGLDAASVAMQLNGLILFPALGVHDQSGVLYLNKENQIERIMAWGQFRQGQAQRLSDQDNAS